jgi:hypothetical protein
MSSTDQSSGCVSEFVLARLKLRQDLVEVTFLEKVLTTPPGGGCASIRNRLSIQAVV